MATAKEEFCQKAYNMLQDEIKANKQDWHEFQDTIYFYQAQVGEASANLDRIAKDSETFRKEEGSHAIFLFNVLRGHCQDVMPVSEQVIFGVEGKYK